MPAAPSPLPAADARRKQSHEEAIAATALIQRQMRKSLNRRREGPAPRVASKGNPPPAGMCSDRLNRLATPRVRRDPVAHPGTSKRLPAVPSAPRIPITRPAGSPRNAWA